MKGRLYRSILRVSSVLLAVVLLFDSGLLSPITRSLSNESAQYVATVVGMGAAVEPTSTNTWTAELMQKERELAQREASLTERELNTGISKNNSVPLIDDLSTFVLSVLLFVVVLLLLLNFALDIKREKYFTRLRNERHV